MRYAGPVRPSFAACQLFRNGKFGLRLAIKIPFFAEIEISLESNG